MDEMMAQGSQNMQPDQRDQGPDAEGTQREQHQRRRIRIGDDDDAMVVFELDHGRRTDPIEAEQLASAVGRQQAVSRAALAQQMSSLADPTVVPNRPGNIDFRRRLALVGQGGAVGFQPVIITLPAGTQMVATGVVSHDRRYVRITAAPSFTRILLTSASVRMSTPRSFAAFESACVKPPIPPRV